MKRPYFNREQRMLIIMYRHGFKTLEADLLIFKLAWNKLLRALSNTKIGHIIQEFIH